MGLSPQLLPPFSPLKGQEKKYSYKSFESESSDMNNFEEKQGFDRKLNITSECQSQLSWPTDNLTLKICACLIRRKLKSPPQGFAGHKTEIRHMEI